MEVAAKVAGGQGGGHNVAAGATIPRKKTDKFLEKVEEIVGETLGKNKGSAEVRPEGSS
jgi:RecJ-like exonuclease